MPFIEIIGRGPLSEHEITVIRDALMANRFTEYFVGHTVVASHPNSRCVALSTEVEVSTSYKVVAVVRSQDTKFLAHIKEVLLAAELTPRIDKVLTSYLVTNVALAD